MAVRDTLDSRSIEFSKELLEESITIRRDKYGRHSYASSHEILGILEAELAELKFIMYVHAKAQTVEDKMAEVKHMLMKIATTAVLGYASMDSGGTDW